ncbi:MAG: helix-turn-helix transcriptional regulator [Bacteroidetes bacterium]|nr:helix-turn-helix transcriptional regulator [Bacteroidota bacterium]
MNEIESVIAKKESIGELIQTRRKSRNIRQADLAEIAGISPRTLRDIEKGIANPEFETLLKIFEVLGLGIRVEIIK